jgi:O-antigen/teichoic acid export membrane protein
LLSGANAIPLAVMQQQLQYRLLAAIDFGKAIAQGATVLLCAVLGFRYWSLAIGLIVGHIVAVLWTRRYVQLIASRPTRAVIGANVSYAQHLVVSALAWSLYSNADFAVVGRVAGLSALGYYQFAWNVAQLPGEKLANVLQAVVLPFFGSIGDNKQALRHYFLILSELLVSVMLPILAGFALVSPIAVPLIFGDKWAASVPIMQVLVACAALSSVSMLSQHVLGATGQAKVTARLNLTALCVLPICFLIAAHLSGPLAVAYVWLLAQPFLVGVPLLKLRASIGLSVREYLRNLRAPFVCAFVMAGAVLAARTQLGQVAPIMQLLLLSSLGAVVYVTCFILIFRDRVTAIVSVWRDR